MQEVNPEAEIELQTTDSTTGMENAIAGSYDIGMASREVKDEELAEGLEAQVIATDGIAVVVNNANPAEDLTSDQVKAIYTGEALTWDESNRINMKSNAWTEKFMQGVFFIAACASVLAVALICIFLFANGLPAMSEIGFLDFLTGTVWKPNNDIYGILPMIVGSLYVTAGAIIFGVPIGILTAVFMAFYCPKQIYKPLEDSHGAAGRDPLRCLRFLRPGGTGARRAPDRPGTCGFGGNGSSMLTASLLLGMMILPTIIGLTESSLRAVPTQYYEGAVALGATHERAIFRVVLPAAKSGTVAAIVLGVGRAIGETMAVIMVAGNQTWMPRGIFRGVRTMTANIVIEMGYATDLHREALIATGVVLFVFILIINFCVALLNRGNSHE